MQLLVSVSSPSSSQLAPAPCGSGLLQDRSRIWLPSPQSLSQLDQSDQSPYPPLTSEYDEEFEIVYKKHTSEKNEAKQLNCINPIPHRLFLWTLVSQGVGVKNRTRSDIALNFFGNVPNRKKN